MMSRTFYSLFAAIVAVCACQSASAQILIGDFEANTVAGNVGALDGWQASSDAAGPTAGSTTGTLSQNANAEIQTLGGVFKNGVADNTGNVLRILPGFHNFWSINLNQVGRPTLAGDLAANPVVKAQVTFRAATFNNVKPDEFGEWNGVALNGQPAGWQQAFPAGNGWNESGGSRTFVATWDLSSFVIANTASGDNAQLILATNFDRGLYDGIGTSGPAFYIDNITLNRAVPEPTSVALLGLGALGFVARRRR